MMRKKLRKGFTLVELLVVIVIIAILSAALMLSATEMASSADAANVINNLGVWKRAAMLWHMDHKDMVDMNGRIIKTDGSRGQFFYREEVSAGEIAKYVSGIGLTVNSDGSVTDEAGGTYYTDYVGNANTYDACMWVIAYYLPENNPHTMKKLEARAKEVGLVNKRPPDKDGFHDPYISSGVDEPIYVAIKVIDFGYYKELKHK